MQRPSGIAISTALNNGGAGSGSAGAGTGAKINAPLLPYRGSADTLKTILRTEGLRGIYKVRPAKGQRARCFALFQQDPKIVVCSPGGAEGGWGGAFEQGVGLSLRLKLPAGIRSVPRVENKDRHLVQVD